ncbi:MAG: chromate transporter [Fastidiosipilaceae bacterium]|jgi:chromate transporter
MIYLELFLGFLRVGCFAFGGAYAAIPLIRDVVLSYGWLDDDKLTYMIAVSESTPGPIMVNLATYVGSSQAGILGSLLATLAVVLPSFIVILVVMIALQHVIKNQYVQAVLRGLKPCIIGIILATGIYMALKSIGVVSQTIDLNAVIIAAVLVGTLLITKRLRKKQLSPISMIILSAALGIILYD